MAPDKKEARKIALVWIAGFIVLWEIVAFILEFVIHDKMASAKLPFLHTIIMTFAGNWQDLLYAAMITFSRAGVGFLLGTCIGVILAVLMSLSNLIEKISLPYLIVSQMIPVLGLAPIIFNIVRDMNTSRIVIAAYITFFPVAVNMLSGLKSVEQDKKELLYSVAATKRNIYYKLMFPYSMSYLYTGLKIAAPMAITASILVDMLGSKEGIGVKILYALYSNSNNMFWAAVLTSAFMGIAIYYIVVLSEKILMPWHNTSSGKAGEAA